VRLADRYRRGVQAVLPPGSRRRAAYERMSGRRG
jgi:hypothetical protein